MSQPSQPIAYILYARKSTESEDRQVASIDSQIQELRNIAEREELLISDVLYEAQSAKAPGRPVFNKMINAIHTGTAQGILCWKLDRLARNPVDGGSISWMLQQGTIQRIQTHDRSYCPTDNVLMMSVEFGMANQFIIDLSQNVKRGLLAKVKQGWFPGVAKSGYLNDTDSVQGQKKVIKDPIRFPLIKRAFMLMLSGTYTPKQILHKLNYNWGYRTPKRRSMGGKPLSRTSLYDIFTDPFYYGEFEFPKGSGSRYQGSHVPMITKEEYWRIQELLGSRGRPRPNKHRFAYAGLMHCGECTAMITTTEHKQTICTACKYKFSSRNRTRCPKCDTAIEAMDDPTFRLYQYYHCTKRKIPTCSQRSLEVKKLECQILSVLDSITVSEDLKNWCLDEITSRADERAETQKPALDSLREAYTDCQHRLSNLLSLKISPQNAHGELLTDAEFAAQRKAIQHEMTDIQRQIAHLEQRDGLWIDACTKTFNFACNAKKHFRTGTSVTKRTIVSALGSNLTLTDQKLYISLHKHFQFIQMIRNRYEPEKVEFEPSNFGSINTQTAHKLSGLCAYLGDRDEVRTFFADLCKKAIFIPDFSRSA